ncbi:unnamed protein product, partial [Didymodactylos carnosus]
ENVPDFHDWFLQYQAEPFRNHLIAAVRIQVDYVNRDGTARLLSQTIDLNLCFQLVVGIDHGPKNKQTKNNVSHIFKKRLTVEK